MSGLKLVDFYTILNLEKEDVYMEKEKSPLTIEI